MNIFAENTLKTGNRNLHVIDSGSKNQTERNTILLFSGAGSDSFDWLPLIYVLSPSYRCLVIDKPGFLNTSCSKKEIQQQIVEDAFHIISELNIRKLFIVGHSLGFISSLLFYHSYKSTIEISGICSLDGIDLCDSTSELLSKMKPPKWITALQRLIILDLGLFRRNMTLKIEDYPESFKPFLDQFRKKISKQRMLKKHTRAILKETNTLPEIVQQYSFLKNIELSVPLLVIKATEANGEESSNENKFFPHLKELIEKADEDGERWKDKLVNKSGGEKVNIQATHFLHGEHPEQVADLILNFIERNQ